MSDFEAWGFPGKTHWRPCTDRVSSLGASLCACARVCLCIWFCVHKPSHDGLLLWSVWFSRTLTGPLVYVASVHGAPRVITSCHTMTSLPPLVSPECPVSPPPFYTSIFSKQAARPLAFLSSLHASCYVSLLSSLSSFFIIILFLFFIFSYFYFVLAPCFSLLEINCRKKEKQKKKKLVCRCKLCLISLKASLLCKKIKWNVFKLHCVWLSM